MGHSAQDDRVALFLMDYENQSRLKMMGHLKMQHAKDADPELLNSLTTTGEGKVDRVATIEVISIDWNCPKYIPQLIDIKKAKAYSDSQFQELKEENQALKLELERLKAKV